MVQRIYVSASSQQSTDTILALGSGSIAAPDCSVQGCPRIGRAVYTSARIEQNLDAAEASASFRRQTQRSFAHKTVHRVDVRARCHENSYAFMVALFTGIRQRTPTIARTSVKRSACRHQSANGARSPGMRCDVEGRSPMAIVCVNAPADTATSLHERLVEGIPCIGPFAVCS